MNAKCVNSWKSRNAFSGSWEEWGQNEPLGTARFHRYFFDWPNRFVDAVKQSGRLLCSEHGKQMSQLLLNFLRTADRVRYLGAH